MSLTPEEISDLIASQKLTQIRRHITMIEKIIAGTDYAGKRFIGSIVPFALPSVVVQDVGRGKYIFHRITNLDQLPAAHFLVQIDYDGDGKGCVCFLDRAAQ